MNLSGEQRKLSGKNCENMLDITQHKIKIIKFCMVKWKKQSDMNLPPYIEQTILASKILMFLYKKIKIISV